MYLNVSDFYITSVVYDSTNQKVVIVYVDNGNSSHGTAIVRKMMEPLLVDSIATYSDLQMLTSLRPVYDSANGKIVAEYQDGGNSDVDMQCPYCIWKQQSCTLLDI